MPRGLQLEVFESAETAKEDSVVLSTEALEEARLAAFEKGYRAGWDDCAAAAEEDQTRLRSDVARSLQTLSFTYEEARAHLLAALAPLLRDMTDRILPEIARDCIGLAVAEALVPLAAAMPPPPVTLVIAPAARAVVDAALDGASTPPLRIEEEPSLLPAQAWLRFDDRSEQIDLDGALEAIRAAVAAFLTPHQTERRHA